MPLGAGQIVYEDDLTNAFALATPDYQTLSTVSVTSSTTPVDIPGSTITVVAGATYWIAVYIAFDGATAGDARFNWTSSDTSNITLDRNIIAPATTITNNTSIADLIMIRRGTTTQQVVGAPGGSASAFTVYAEIAILTALVDGTAKMQFAQGTSSATASVVQSGYMLTQRVA